jgi:hypothetical protein
MKRYLLHLMIIAGVLLSLFAINIWIEHQTITGVCIIRAGIFDECTHVNGFSVGTIWMILSLPVFAFVTTLLLQLLVPSKKYFLLPPCLVILWILFSELIVSVARISIIYVNPLEGDHTITSGLFFSFTGVSIITVAMGIVAMIMGYFGNAIIIFLREEASGGGKTPDRRTDRPTDVDY